MNSTRANCDRHFTQSVMRNIAFPLQTRNQRGRIRLSSARGYGARKSRVRVCIAVCSKCIHRCTAVEIGSGKSSEQNLKSRNARDATISQSRAQTGDRGKRRARRIQSAAGVSAGDLPWASCPPRLPHERTGVSDRWHRVELLRSHGYVPDGHHSTRVA
jgi:hypothetical protein